VLELLEAHGVAVIAAALLLLGSSSASAVADAATPDVRVGPPVVATAPTPGAAARARRPRIVAVGDSITWGIGTAHPGRQGWAGRLGAQRVAHIAGCLVTSCWHQLPAVETWRRQVLILHPDVVIVAYGFNDLVWSPSRRIMLGLRSVVRMDAKRGVRTFVATLTPLHPGHALEPYRTDLNARIRRVFAAQLVDFDAALAVDGVLPPQYDSGDGLHPNVAGYRVMAHVAEWALTCAGAMSGTRAPCPMADIS
jgi:lysophospholipase L1-like esterase